MGEIRYIDIHRADGSKHLPGAAVDLSRGYHFNDAQMPGGSEPTLKDFFSLLKKRLTLVAACTFAFGFLGLLYCLTTDKYYTASSNIEIKGYNPVLAGASVENLYGADTRKLDYQKTAVAKLKRLVVADRVLMDDALEKRIVNYLDARKSFFSRPWREILGIANEQRAEAPSTASNEPHFKHTPKLLSKYLGLIDISPVHETSIVQVSVTTTSPNLSQALANAHAKAFIEELRNERQEAVMSNLKVLQTQSDELKTKLAAAEQEMARYAQSNQLVAVANAQDANIVVKQIINLTDLLTQATAKRVKSESMLREVETKDPKTDASGIDDEEQRGARQALEQAQAEYASVRQRVTDEYPQAQELKARIASLRGSIQESHARQLASLRMQYRSDVSAEKKLIEQIDLAKAQAHDMSKRLVQYNLLMKESDSVRQLYETVLRQVQETQVSGAGESNNIVISDYAARPTRPSAPLTKLVTVIALVLGAIIGILAAILLEAFNNKLRTPDDISTALRLPLLGYVPAFSTDAKLSQGGIRRRVQRLLSSKPHTERPQDVVDPSAGPIDPMVNAHLAKSELRKGENNGHSFVTISAPQAVVSEALRTIRASILLSSPERPPQVLMTTSSEKGEGKTTVTSNLAIALAQAGHRTLLIDADLRQSKVSSLFNLPRSLQGLSEYLTGQCEIGDVINKTAINNVEILASGTVPPNPAELLGSAKMKELIEQLREQYDFVLIDCPPILPVADGLMVSCVVDAVLFVTRSNTTDRGAALEAQRRLRNVNARILGVILNDLDFTKAEHGVGSMASHSYYSNAANF